MGEIRTQSAARLLYQLSNRFFGRPQVGRARAEGEAKVNDFKWTSNTRVLVCIIAALLLVIWFALLQQYY